ncbi:MAG: TetR family transcriptional regulator [Clostridiales bacterium]|nr:TetR family transcriptional regulator [Clostridiales bacterium]
MKNPNFIKLEIARNLKEMAEEQPLENITVSSLCKRCDINRGTFYYHFIDIYDLIIWIFETEVIQPLETYLLQHNFGSWNGITSYCLNQMYKSRKFYCQAVRIEGQNNLRDYMQKRNRDCWELLIRKYINANLSTGLYSEEYLNFLIKYTSQAVCNMTIAWAMDGMTIPVDIMAKMDDVATKGIYGVVDSLANK